MNKIGFQFMLWNIAYIIQKKVIKDLSRKMCKFYKIFVPAVFKAAGFVLGNSPQI